MHKDENSTLILLGNPNVGKSQIFGLLTGKYVVVSNYPGTTVEVAKGICSCSGKCWNVIDTPGILSLFPMSSDEVVTRDILFKEKDFSVLLIGDAKNPARLLLLALQLSEMEIPFTIALNMIDEASELRISTNVHKLSEILGVRVIPSVAVTGFGINQIKNALCTPQISHFRFRYDPLIENSIEEIIRLLPEDQKYSRSVALMLLSEDQSVISFLNDTLKPENFKIIDEIVRKTKSAYPEPLAYVINRELMEAARAMADEVTVYDTASREGITNKIGAICTHRIYGIPILIAVLLLMYFFVGRLAAGTVVDFLSRTVFDEKITPWLVWLLNTFNANQLIKDFFTGHFGIVSTGLKYAFAIVLPIVAAFFFFFGFLEDSGYLPRLSVMANRACRLIGLNGKAVLPMVLGLGCGTMAAISTRILDTKKERLIVILLLGLGIPCSAQLGVILGMLSGLSAWATIIWLFIIIGSILLVGWAASKVLPGEESDFILEIPPLRFPSIKNIFIKTFARVEWYLAEAVPLFLVATFILFLADRAGVLLLVEKIFSPILAGILGLPAESAGAFITGFIRRDFGAALFLNMARSGVLSGNQILIAMVVISLFLPCVAQLLVMIKEKGWKAALGISVFVLFYSVMAGALLRALLRMAGVNL